MYTYELKTSRDLLNSTAAYPPTPLGRRTEAGLVPGPRPGCLIGPAPALAGLAVWARFSCRMQLYFSTLSELRCMPNSSPAPSRSPRPYPPLLSHTLVRCACPALALACLHLSILVEPQCMPNPLSSPIQPYPTLLFHLVPSRLPDPWFGLVLAVDLIVFEYLIEPQSMPNPSPALSSPTRLHLVPARLPGPRLGWFGLVLALEPSSIC